MQQLVNNYPKNYFFTLFLSCEGTRYTEDKRLESMQVAQEKGLPELKHHILPRTKGFVLVMQGLNKHIAAVYDITVAFQSPVNPELQNLLIGSRCQCEAYVRRIPISNIPIEDETKCAEWLHKLFQEKDKVFEYFLTHKTFNGRGLPMTNNLKRKSQDLIIELLCLFFVGIPSIVLLVIFLWTSSLQSQIILVTLVMATVLGVRLMIHTSSKPKKSK